MMLLFPWATRCSFNSCLPLGSIWKTFIHLWIWQPYQLGRKRFEEHFFSAARRKSANELPLF
jgi:hypothetical protein